MRATSSTDTAGFTLLEMLTVLSIVALLSVAMAGRIGSDGPPLDRVAAEIARELRGVQGEAVTTGRDITVSTAPEDGGRALAPPEDIGARILDEPGDEVETLVFFGAGGSTGGRIELARGNARAVIEVDWLTGSVAHE